MASAYSSKIGFVRDADKKKEKIAAAQEELSKAKSQDSTAEEKAVAEKAAAEKLAEEKAAAAKAKK